MAIKSALLLCLSFALLATPSQYCSECSLPWQSFRGFCYLLVDVPKSFWEAEGYCKSLSRGRRDAHLVSVTDDQEEDFIEEYTKPSGQNDIRIGFVLNHTTDDYYWVDGITSRYTDWDAAEPTRNGEDCAVLKLSTHWNDRGCDNPYPFICKIPGKYTK
ncbi:C-type lectin BfL-2-like [Asterias rubens]|uniref:C-type lectin BfL-2-like n=1 Tax=Asterias rubens TaxID=7604 RepID=UPI001455757D|nr:C-type lectin BfL-2-like [Asterias rubens]